MVPRALSSAPRQLGDPARATFGPLTRALVPSAPTMAADLRPDPGSFRDPSSRVWLTDDSVFRGLEAGATDEYRALAETRFFEAAIQAGDFIGTGVSDESPAALGSYELVLEHERVPLVTYPYEWPFSMLREAALLQLRLLREALEVDFTSKDASAYNVQFIGSRPVFIDVPSFERYREGEPWWGYRQFCQLFLFPLLLTAYKDLPHQPWLRGAVDGIPPEQARRVLEGRRHGHKGFLTHVWFQARAESRFADSERDTVSDLKQSGYKRELFVATVDKLTSLIEGLEWQRADSEWAGYGDRTHYEEQALSRKRDLVSRVAGRTHRRQAMDIGANDGMFSRLVADHADHVLAVDADELVVDRLYRDLREAGEERILPLVMNLADPSPGIGWRGIERPSFLDRVDPDLVLALAVIHHLVLTHNVPIASVLDLFHDLDSEMVLEIPTEQDPMVRRLVARKTAGVHDDYTIEIIEAGIRERFDVRERCELPGGTRVAFHLAPKG